jgi:hypothetical protein
MSVKTTKIDFLIESLMPDRTTYKQYSIKFAGTGIFVQVEVPNDYIVTHNLDITVLTPAGLAWVADQLATAIDNIHAKQLNERK